MKKIFISIPWFLPAFRAGGPVQSIANLVAQTDLDCTFYIFCGDTDLNGEPLAGIIKDQWVDHNKVTKVYYASPGNRQQTLKQEVSGIRPDIIFVIGIFSKDFNINPMLLRQYDQTIISARGMLHPGALSQKPLKKKIFLAWFKMLGFHKKFRFHATDESEADFVRQKMGSQVRVSVAGNFPRLFTPGHHKIKKPGTLRLMCLALISPMKNHLLVLESLAGITSNIEFHIAGAVKDPVYWQTCLSVIDQLPPNISVKVHGDMPPHEVAGWLSSGDVFIMPSKSENFGHALIEAMSAGLPVITSHFTPWNKLVENKAGINAGLTKDSVSDAIRFFADMDEGDMETWRHAASNYAYSSVDHIRLREQYGQLFSAVV